MLKARTALREAGSAINVGLYSNGVVTDSTVVTDWWRKHFETEIQASVSDQVMECLVSGRFGPVAKRHPKIKQLCNIGGKAEVLLASFDEPAFESYGWRKSLNAPTSVERAWAYVLALNKLLEPRGKHRKDINGVAYVFWLRQAEEAEEDPFDCVLRPDPEQVKKLLEFDRLSHPDPNQFYMAVLTANGSRLVLRSWVTETLPAVKGNLRDWFLGLRIQPRFVDQEQRPPSIKHLVEVLNKPVLSPDGGQKNKKKNAGPEKNEDAAKKKRSDPSAIALVLRALRGDQSPLGYSVLQRLMRRILVDKNARTDPAPMGLLRLCVNDMRKLNPEGEVMTEECNENSRNPAYVCGRLLAIHERLQRTAFTEGHEEPPRVTVADRFYSLACVSPALAMPRVFELGIKHLSKLRRMKGKDGLAEFFRKQIAQRRELIKDDPFPGTLSMQDKGRFALGYYHEIAWRSKPAGNSDLHASEIEEQLDQIDEEEEEEEN